MATTVDTLLVRIEADMSDLRRDLNRVAAQTENTANRMQDSFAKVGRALAAIGGTAVLGSLIKGFISTGAQVENLGVRFNTLFGSAEEGGRAFQVMADYASQVPFSLEDIQRGAAPLATVGKNAKQLGTLMKLTGNIAAASGMSFDEASQNVQRALTAGINSADMFRERGVSAMAGFQAGTTYSVQETLDKLRDAFGAGGKYDGITDDLAKTTTGAVSMLGDSWFSFQRIVAESGLNEAFIDLVNILKDVLDAAKPLGVIIGHTLAFAFKTLGDIIIFVRDNLRSFIIAIGVYLSLAVVANISLAVIQFTKLARAIKASGIAMRFFNQITKRTPLLLIAAALGYTADQLGLIDEAVEHAAKAFDELLPESVRKDLDKFGKGFLADVDGALDAIEGADSGEVSLGTAIDPKKLSDVQKLLESTKNPAVELTEQIALLKSAMGGLNGPAREQAVEALAQLEEKLKETEPMDASFKSSVQTMASSVSNAFADMLANGKLNMDSLKDIFRSFVKTMIAKAIELFVINRILSMIFPGAYMTTSAGAFVPRASGGAMSARQPYLVGERGPELVVPNSASTVMNSNNTRSALGGGGDTTIVQNINISTGVQQTVRSEIRSLMPEIANTAKAAVVDTKRRGGSYGRAFA